MREDTIDLQGLGSRIRHLRVALGMSQSDLSMESKVPQTTIFKIERGDTVAPRVDTLQQIAVALGVTIRELLAPAGEVGEIASAPSRLAWLFELAPDTPPELLSEAINLYVQLPRAVQEALVETLRAIPKVHSRDGVSENGVEQSREM